jgi:hypothetical protein
MRDRLDETLVIECPVPAEAYEKYRGKWIAVRGGQIVAVAGTLKELWADKRLVSEASAYHVPETPYTFH